MTFRNVITLQRCSRDRRKEIDVLIEQPDPRAFRFSPARRTSSLGVGFFPDPWIRPRLGHFPDALLDRLELLLARLLDAALDRPSAGAARRAAVRRPPVSTSASRAFRKGFLRRGGSFVRPVRRVLQVAAATVRVARPLRCWRLSLRRGALIGWRRCVGVTAPPPVCGCGWLRLRLRLRLWRHDSWSSRRTCGTGSAGAVETGIGSADILRSSLETACAGGLAMFAAR